MLKNTETHRGFLCLPRVPGRSSRAPFMILVVQQKVGNAMIACSQNTLLGIDSPIQVRYNSFFKYRLEKGVSNR